MKRDDIFRKLRLEPGKLTLIVNAPQEFFNILDTGTVDTALQKGKKGKYEFVQVFGTLSAELEKLVIQIAGAGKYDCIFWVCYPKGSGKINSDIKRDAVWKIAEKAGFRCVSQIAIDETWSALRLRPPEKVGK
jgi:hypothetical protein